MFRRLKVDVADLKMGKLEISKRDSSAPQHYIDFLKELADLSILSYLSRPAVLFQTDLKKNAEEASVNSVNFHSSWYSDAKAIFVCKQKQQPVSEKGNNLVGKIRASMSHRAEKKKKSVSTVSINCPIGNDGDGTTLSASLTSPTNDPSKSVELQDERYAIAKAIYTKQDISMGGFFGKNDDFVTDHKLSNFKLSELNIISILTLVIATVKKARNQKTDFGEVAIALGLKKDPVETRSQVKERLKKIVDSIVNDYCLLHNLAQKDTGNNYILAITDFYLRNVVMRILDTHEVKVLLGNAYITHPEYITLINDFIMDDPLRQFDPKQENDD